MTPRWVYPIDRATTAVPQDYLLHFVDSAVQYGRGWWLAYMTGTHPPAPPPMFTAAYLAELRHAATTFAQAARNPIVLDWDASAYAASVGAQDGANAKFENTLREQFHAVPKNLSQPTTMVDCAGVIQLWYCPDALRSDRLTKTFVGFEKLHEILTHNGPRPSRKSNWRWNSGFFADTDVPTETPPGLATFALWHAQGHDRYRDEVHVSADLGGNSPPAQSRYMASRDWIRDELELGGLISLGIAIPSPEQYALSRECLLRLAEKRPQLAPILRNWPFAANAISVVSNRCAPSHRDRASGGERWYDVLATFGGDRRVTVHLEGLGLRCQYSSGTMLTFSGHVHLHSVSDSPKDRICIAAYARRSVHAAMDLPPPRFVTLDSLLKFA